MSKTRSQYVCSNCGGIQMKWMGKCPDCGEWNTLEEVEVRAPEKGRSVMPNARNCCCKSPTQLLPHWICRRCFKLFPAACGKSSGTITP